MRVHVSNKSEKNVVTLGLYENHFVYIKDISMICKVFRCDKCKKQFTRHNNLISHQKTECSELYKVIFAKMLKSLNTMKTLRKKFYHLIKVKSHLFIHTLQFMILNR